MLKSIIVCEALAKVTYFRDTPLSVLQAIFKKGTTQLYKQNSYIIKRNEPTVGLCVVLRGQLGYVDDSGVNTFAQISSEQEEPWVGECSFFKPLTVSSANVKALTPCYIFCITSHNMDQLFNKYETKPNADELRKAFDIHCEYCQSMNQKLSLELEDQYLKKLKGLCEGEIEREVILKSLRKIDVFSTADASYLNELIYPFPENSVSASEKYIILNEVNEEVTITSFLLLKGILMEVDVDGNAVRSLLRGAYHDKNTVRSSGAVNISGNSEEEGGANSRGIGSHKLIVGETPCILLAITT